jgi:hypothetical protein
MFRQISEIALDGVSAELQAKYGWHTAATGSIETLNPSPVAPLTLEGGARQRMGIKDGGATDFSPTKLPPLWKTPQGGVRLGGFVKADMSMVTVNAATKGMPQPSAVIIDMLAWKAAHLSPPTTARTSSAAKTRAKPATK